MTRSEAGKLGKQASLETEQRLHQERIERYLKQPNTCKYCGRVLSYEKRKNKFCCQSCAAIYNNHERASIATVQKTPKYPDSPWLCLNCGTSMHGHDRHKKFCSVQCSIEYHKNQKYAQIELTGEFPEAFQQEASRRLVKKYLTDKYGHKCSICGITEWMGKPVPLIVDHIDGNALNRRVDNFRLVCANCDAQLPTYKSKNKKGRKWRRKYEHD